MPQHSPYVPRRSSSATHAVEAASGKRPAGVGHNCQTSPQDGKFPSSTESSRGLQISQSGVQSSGWASVRGVVAGRMRHDAAEFGSSDQGGRTPQKSMFCVAVFFSEFPVTLFVSIADNAYLRAVIRRLQPVPGRAVGIVAS